MMTGNRRIGDLKRVILHAPDRGALRLQIEDATGHALVQDNKFGHSLMNSIMSASRFKSNGNLGRHAKNFSRAFQSANGIRRTTASNHAAPAMLRDDIAH